MPARINIPPVTRALLSSIVALSLLYGVARWRRYGNSVMTAPIPYLALVPGEFLFYPWTLVSATFVERNLFTLLINGAILFYGGKYLERAWGSKEFAKFVLIVALISNVAAVFLYILCAAFFSNSLLGYGHSDDLELWWHPALIYGIPCF
jgi:membrane associated rhomboid family serine protease